MPTEISKTIVVEAIKEVSKKMKRVNGILKEYNVFLSNKNLSEIIGKISETTFAEVLTKHLGYEVKYAKADAEPDLFFTKTKEKFEIKMSSTSSGWQGGEFSTRPTEYFLITWGGDFDEFFVAKAHLTDKEWYSHIANRRYGTSYPAKDLFNKKEKIIYLGKLEQTKRGAIRIVREKID
ncbi:MAG: hypothetical protein ACREBF_02825 [Candidatus Micrarchaeales archaeon]